MQKFEVIIYTPVVTTLIINFTIEYASQIITIHTKTEIMVDFDFDTSSSFHAEVRILNQA